MDETLSYVVKIETLQNAEGTFRRIGQGTLIIDNIRDEVKLLGRKRFSLGFWIFILCLILWRIILAPFRFDSTVALVISVIVFVGLYFLTRAIPGREVSVKIPQAQLATVG